VGIELRLAERADATGITDVYVASWRAGYERLLANEVLDEQCQLRRNRDWLRPIESSSTTVVVAVQHATIVGVVQADEHLDEEERDLPEITMLYVDPASWGGPAASDLLAAGSSWIRARGHDAARLRVVENQDRARRFYEREGWMLDTDLPPASNGFFRLVYYRRDLSTYA
jgi:GNAT superfamily N-acetyltransferase